MVVNKVNHFSFGEEVWHSITHGVGFFLSIVALSVLVAFASIKGTTIDIVSVAIYGATLIILYGSSTLYHAITHTEVKRLLQKFDHSAIYFLIAGTYTPVLLLSVGGVAGWTLCIIEWSIALIGISLKFLYPNRFEVFSLLAYVVMGWLVVVIFETFKNGIDPVGFWLIVAGGIAYTGGIIFYVKDNIVYFHTIWHLFVLLGSVLHFFAVLLYVL
ncbi:MAG: COG1272: Predicted membrane protein hemolysin III homolog [uncultured Sulfurovum sp.]|uniref:COG1272: Predicted membrane protein hemolysin III homolog n=1 Tax=uncultured Sulfurovum sp. TaxID=269237 RepID=A0A6S6RVC0_9BACT|nr:MAG: COG1272: Predicted membrane protein hemolysin III homolog [uncultured Sulfurovum sp.]